MVSTINYFYKKSPSQIFGRCRSADEVKILFKHQQQIYNLKSLKIMSYKRKCKNV